MFISMFASLADEITFNIDFSNRTICLFCASGAEWALKAATVMSAYVTQDAFMEPASNHGNATARKAGVASSATKVRKRAERKTHKRSKKSI